jgi:hypothetical protein
MTKIYIIGAILTFIISLGFGTYLAADEDVWAEDIIEVVMVSFAVSIGWFIVFPLLGLIHGLTTLASWLGKRKRKCYYKGCTQTPKYHVFVEPGTYACIQHWYMREHGVTCTKCLIIWEKGMEDGSDS